MNRDELAERIAFLAEVDVVLSEEIEEC